MKNGLNDSNKIQAEIEQAQGRFNTAKRKAKKKAKLNRLIDLIETYTSNRSTGNINWTPKHSLGKERWVGTLDGKELFKIETMVYKYHMKVLNEELYPKAKSITGKSFDELSSKAESIIENYIKKYKKTSKINIQAIKKKDNNGIFRKN